MSEETKKAQEKFGALIESEYARIERMKADQEITDFASLEKIVIGVLPGDGVEMCIRDRTNTARSLLCVSTNESGVGVGISSPSSSRP